VKNLNTASKAILLIGLMAFVASGTVVPWKMEEGKVPAREGPPISMPAEPLGYMPIWRPPAKPQSDSAKFQSTAIDTTRLFIQWAVIIAGTAAGIVVAQNREDSGV